MGILNVTPDSFFDGGRHDALDAAVARARAMIDEGVDIIDVGGESTRPGAEEIDVDEEIARTAPVIEAISQFGVPVSIDTRKAKVAKAALDAGATIVNDVSGGTFDDQMFPLVADRGADVIVMHMRGTPATMDGMTTYTDVVADVRSELAERVTAARSAGVDASRISVDPGLGFAKDSAQSRELLARIDEIDVEGLPVVVGPSRKRFIGGEASDRLAGTLAAVAWCASKDVAVVRVHDVADARRVTDLISDLVR